MPSLGMLNSFRNGAVPPFSLNIRPGDETKYTLLPYASATIIQNVNASGGVPPYTYLASYVSGDTEISGSDLTTDTPEFVCTGDGTMINSWTAVWNFQVTDSAATVLDQDITMTFVFGLNPP